MRKILLMAGIIGLAVCSGKLTPEQTEREKVREIARSEAYELKKIARGDYKYTLSHKDNDLFTDKLREYCKMQEKYFEMFFLLQRGAKECRRCEDDNMRIVELKYLCGSDSPRKWMEYVIFYSLEKRLLDISDDELFIGIAIYSQYYNVTGKHRDLLIDNLFELYIKKKILWGENGSFYNRIYATRNIKDDSRDDDEEELLLIEGVMKAVILTVLTKYKLQFSYEDRTGNLRIHEDDNPYSLEDWRNKRELLWNGEVASFSNVVMARVPADRIDDDDKKRILLTLIGMVRTGQNILSVGCLCWFGSDEFNEVLKLVNTNRNIVGVTELNSYTNFDKLLGSLRGQLRYLEIEFRSSVNCNKIIGFINNLENRISIDASFREFSSVGATVQKLLDSAKIKRILKLQLMSPWADSEFSALKFSLGDSKIHELELHNTKMSLEKILIDDDFRTFRDRVSVLEVSSIGSIERIAGADLKDLELDRLCINKRNEGREEAMNLDQLIKRDIITRDGFKYLTFIDIHSENVPEIVDLRNMLGKRAWPVILTNFEPSVTKNKDYTRICGGCLYMLHARRVRKLKLKV